MESEETFEPPARLANWVRYVGEQSGNADSCSRAPRNAAIPDAAGLAPRALHVIKQLTHGGEQVCTRSHTCAHAHVHLCAFPRPRSTPSGYTTVMPAGFARGACLRKLSDQVMFPHSGNNTDGVCHFCGNKFCILFRGHKKDRVRESECAARVTQIGGVLAFRASFLLRQLPLPVCLAGLRMRNCLPWEDSAGLTTSL